MKNIIQEETIKKILEIKEQCMISGIDTNDIAFLADGQLSEMALGLEKSVIFTEIAGIKIINIVGCEEE